MEISFTGQVSQADFLQAQTLHRKSTAPLILGAIFVFMLIVTGVTSFSNPVLLGTSLPVLAFLAILTGLTWGLPRFQAISIWKNSKIFQNPLSGKVTEQRIHYDSSYSESNISWKAYTHYKRSPRMVLLYQSPNTMNIFLKTFFKDEGDWEAFNNLVATNISADKAATGMERVQKFLVVGFVVLMVLLAVSGFLFSLFGADR